MASQLGLIIQFQHQKYKAMHPIKVIAFLVLCICCNGKTTAQKIQQAALAKELKAMRKTDQKLRKKWAKLAYKGKTETRRFKKLTDRSLASDKSHTKRLKEIIAQYGWPTYDLVGKPASVGAWLIVQHADRDPLFQMKCLPLLKDAAEHGQSDLVNYAFLYDRVQIAKGDKQLYATQSTTNNGITKGNFQPIEDEANVQNRRAEMGFDLHVESYAKKLGFDYKIPSKEEAINKANDFENNYKINIKKAKAAMAAQDYHQASDHYINALNSYGSTQNQDYIEAAKAQSLSKHKESPWAAFYLIRAAIRGYENYDSFKDDTDFAYLKEASKRNWDTLMHVVNALNENKQ